MSNHESGCLVDAALAELTHVHVLSGAELRKIAEQVKDNGGSISAARLEKALKKHSKTISNRCQDARKFLRGRNFQLSVHCFT